MYGTVPAPGDIAPLVDKVSPAVKNFAVETLGVKFKTEQVVDAVIVRGEDIGQRVVVAVVNQHADGHAIAAAI